MTKAEQNMVVEQCDTDLAEEIVNGANIVSRDGYYELDIDKVAAVLAKHRLATSDAAYRRGLEDAAKVARNRMVEQEWPPQDGDQQIDEVMEAIRALSPAGDAPAVTTKPKRGDKIKWARGLERRPLAVRDLEYVTVASWGLPDAPLAVTLAEVAGTFPMGLFDRGPFTSPSPAALATSADAYVRLKEAVTLFLQLKRSIMIDVGSCHANRDPGASSEMRSDDREMRDDIENAYAMLESALAAKEVGEPSAFALDEPFFDGFADGLGPPVCADEFIDARHNLGRQAHRD
jgi:hypothetical protein